ncbi:hypothetical protein TIFTF001_023930 [Ficus carica]|uniref:Uncharacterized protein n=1 Tax=Ficus carica TaxID=3494 RepID=A0AA88AFN5_FICCA|nr:hypothetical protein TIFTF001_023930 [Ficus carica]
MVQTWPAEQADSDDSLDIVKWVRRKVNLTNGVFQVLDPKVPSSLQQEMLGALDLALRCTSVMPEKRPSTFEVVKSLQSLGSKTCLPSIEFSASEDHSVLAWKPNKKTTPFRFTLPFV